jgi:cytochrome c oxidase assembly protein subunit 15
LLSAYIRLAEVGIGCEPWPQCYAVLNPGEEKKGITVLTEQGQTMEHRGARLAHRYIASALGMFVIALFVMSLRARRELRTGLGVPTTALLVTVFLALLGYYTPTRDNPLITMGNLLGGMALLALLWWMMQRNAETIPGEMDRPRRRLAVVALLLVGLQISLGGWSSANYASSACSGLMSCSEPWLGLAQYRDAYAPLRDIPLDTGGQVIPRDSNGTMSMTHRVFALLTAAYLAWLVRRLRPNPRLRSTALALSIFSIGLIIVGVSAIWLGMPLALLSLHNAVAAGLLLAGTQLLHKLTPTRLPVSPLPG